MKVRKIKFTEKSNYHLVVRKTKISYKIKLSRIWKDENRDGKNERE